MRAAPPSQPRSADMLCCEELFENSAGCNSPEPTSLPCGPVVEPSTPSRKRQLQKEGRGVEEAPDGWVVLQHCSVPAAGGAEGRDRNGLHGAAAEDAGTRTVRVQTRGVAAQQPNRQQLSLGASDEGSAATHVLSMRRPVTGKCGGPGYTDEQLAQMSKHDRELILRNRESAARSKQRQQVQKKSLERKVTDMQTQLSGLEATIRNLRQKNEELHQMNCMYEQQINLLMTINNDPNNDASAVDRAPPALPPATPALQRPLIQLSAHKGARPLEVMPQVGSAASTGIPNFTNGHQVADASGTIGTTLVGQQQPAAMLHGMPNMTQQQFSPNLHHCQATSARIVRAARPNAPEKSCGMAMSNIDATAMSRDYKDPTALLESSPAEQEQLRQLFALQAGATRFAARPQCTINAGCDILGSTIGLQPANASGSLSMTPPLGQQQPAAMLLPHGMPDVMRQEFAPDQRPHGQATRELENELHDGVKPFENKKWSGW